MEKEAAHEEGGATERQPDCRLCRERVSRRQKGGSRIQRNPTRERGDREEIGQRRDRENEGKERIGSGGAEEKEEKTGKWRAKRHSRKQQKEEATCAKCGVAVCTTCSLKASISKEEGRAAVCYHCLPEVMLARGRLGEHESREEQESRVRSCSLANMLEHIQQTSESTDKVRHSLNRIRRSTLSDSRLPVIDLNCESAEKAEIREDEEEGSSGNHLSEFDSEDHPLSGSLGGLTPSEILHAISMEVNAQNEFQRAHMTEEEAERDSKFETLGSGKVTLKLKVVDKIAKGMLWYCGMTNGGKRKFNRRPIEKVSARKMDMEDVGKLRHIEIPVPYHHDLSVYGYDLEELLGPHAEEFAKKRALMKAQQERDAPDNIWKMPAIAYEPARADRTLLPVLLWVHGGGFVMGSPSDSVIDRVCRQMCNAVNCVVVSIDYRLAPEFKWPTQVEDTYAALEWVYRHGKEQFGADVTRIAVGGDSAGGNLAAVVSQLARDRKGPAICHSLLVYPGIHGGSTDSDSHRKYAKGPVITRSLLFWFKNQYFDCPQSDCCMHTTASPLLIPSVKHLPPTTLIIAGMDPLADHAVEYGKRLRGGGIPCVCTVYKNSPHGFFLNTLEESKEAQFEAIVNLKFHFQAQQEVVSDLIKASRSLPSLVKSPRGAE